MHQQNLFDIFYNYAPQYSKSYEFQSKEKMQK